MAVKQKKYNIIARIRSLRNEGYKIINDKAAIVHAQGVEALHLKKMNKYLPLPKFDVFETGIKGESYVSLYQTGDKEFYYLMPKINVDSDKVSLEFDPQERNMLAWYIHARRLIEKTINFQDFMEKYGAMITMAVLVGGAIVIIAMLVQQVSPLIDQIGSISGALNNVADKLAANAATGASGSGAPW